MIGRAGAIYRNYFVTAGCPRPLRRGVQLLWYRKVQPRLLKTNQSTVPLEVVIPAIEKDVITLPHAVRGVQRNLLHPIKRISVVAPESEAIRHVCDDLAVSFVEESSVAPMEKRDLGYRVDGKDRSGWLLQQLIKLNSDTIVGTEHFLVLDADTVLTAPQSLVAKDRTVLLASDEYHRPYYDAYRNLLGDEPKSVVSYVCHYMLFEKAHLHALKRAITEHAGRAWAEAIYEAAEKTDASGFSEYETYGNFVTGRSPRSFVRRYSNNRAVLDADLTRISDLEHEFDGHFDSVSYHVYD